MDIPNLFAASDEAQRLYSLMLLRLVMHEEYDLVLEAAAKIRQHAIETVGERDALFTTHFERDAYWDLKRHHENWDRHVRLEQVLYGHMLKLTDVTSVGPDIRMIESRVPLHFACGRFADAAACKELYLALVIPLGVTDELMHYVTNDDDEPTHPARVTLRHIYQSLNKPLEEWENWPAFVTGLSDRLVVSAKTTKERLVSDSKQLLAVEEALTERRRKTIRRRRPAAIRPSPWESELVKWFPFITSYPSPRPTEEPEDT